MTEPLRLFDGHNDVLLALTHPRDEIARSFFDESAHGHLDLPRAVRGGFGGGFFAMFTPPTGVSLDATPAERSANFTAPIDQSRATKFVDEMIALARDLEEESSGSVKIVHDLGEFDDAWANATITMILHIEGAEAIGADLDELHELYARGLRSLGPVWSRSNIFGHGVPFRHPSSPDTGDGLTERGIALVRECDALGVMIDLSHLNEKGFWDVQRHTTRPLVATHSCAHAICPSARNLTDAQLDAIAESDGVVGTNFCIMDVRPDGKHVLDTPLEMIADQIDYLAERMGIEHVAIGSDFDGAPISKRLGGADGLPRLFEVLRERGWSSEELQALTVGNWRRVLSKTWRQPA